MLLVSILWIELPKRDIEQIEFDRIFNVYTAGNSKHDRAFLLYTLTISLVLLEKSSWLNFQIFIVEYSRDWATRQNPLGIK